MSEFDVNDQVVIEQDETVFLKYSETLPMTKEIAEEFLSCPVCLYPVYACSCTLPSPLLREF